MSKQISFLYIVSYSDGVLRHLTFVRCTCIASAKKTHKWRALNSNYSKMRVYYSYDVLLVNKS